MKTTFPIFLLIAINLPCFSQTSRFDNFKPRNYDFNLYVKQYDPQKDPAIQKQCKKMIQMVSDMVYNMELVYDQEEFREFYTEEGNWLTIDFTNSDWIDKAEWIFADGIFKSTFVVMTTSDGRPYFFPDVPKHIFNTWEKATSPGRYFHSKIKQYSLMEIVPDFCK